MTCSNHSHTRQRFDRIVKHVASLTDWMTSSGSDGRTRSNVNVRPKHTQLQAIRASAGLWWLKKHNAIQTSSSCCFNEHRREYTGTHTMWFPVRRNNAFRHRPSTHTMLFWIRFSRPSGLNTLFSQSHMQSLWVFPVLANLSVQKICVYTRLNNNNYPVLYSILLHTFARNQNLKSP